MAPASTNAVVATGPSLKRGRAVEHLRDRPPRSRLVRLRPLRAAAGSLVVVALALAHPSHEGDVIESAQRSRSNAPEPGVHRLLRDLVREARECPRYANGTRRPRCRPELGRAAARDDTGLAQALPGIDLVLTGHSPGPSPGGRAATSSASTPACTTPTEAASPPPRSGDRSSRCTPSVGRSGRAGGLNDREERRRRLRRGAPPDAPHG